MKYKALLGVLIIAFLSACDKNPADEPFVPASKPMPSGPTTLNPLSQDAVSSGELPPGHPAINNEEPVTPREDAPVEMTERATVISSIDIPQFTYIEVKQGSGTRWLAASKIIVKKGDTIKFDEGSTMSNFNSKVLDRTFPSITFVNRVALVKGK